MSLTRLRSRPGNGRYLHKQGYTCNIQRQLEKIRRSVPLRAFSTATSFAWARPSLRLMTEQAPTLEAIYLPATSPPLSMTLVMLWDLTFPTSPKQTQEPQMARL